MFDPMILIFELLDEYARSRGMSPTLPYYVNVRIIICCVLLFVIIGELIIYIAFFHHMYKHDNTEILRRLLYPNVIRTRNRRNAITFFGQFCSFVLEIAVTLLFTICTTTRISIIIAVEFRRMAFMAMAMVEVLTCMPLRTRMLTKLNYARDKILDGLFGIIFGLE